MPRPLLIATQYRPTMRIVIAAEADQTVRYAAEELQLYLDRMAHAYANIDTDVAPQPERAIYVGASAHSRVAFPDASTAGLNRDGYLLKSGNGSLLIQGTTSRGTLYGVYDVLERLGVRWWTPREESVPFRTVVELPPLDVRVSPPLFYRATWYRNAMDSDWQARMRLSGGTMGPVFLRPRHGNMEIYANNHGGHTYTALVPPDQYWDSHPEYYSEIKGVRQRYTTQLCCTNPAVADIAAESLRAWMQNTPDARMASVTQDDHNNWCTCANCAALIEREGTPAAPALHLANEVAKRLERDFPDVLIHMFGYSFTQKPPAHMTAHPNILVQLAPISNCFGHPIRTCAANAECREALTGWSRIAQHLSVWHYVTDFFHYLSPFPNLPSFEDDLHFYLEHGLKGIFLQGDGNSWGGDMCELKAYLFARMAWDPSLRMEAVRAEFLTGFYRAAAPAVEEYIATFERAFADAGDDTHLFLYRTLWDNDAPYLTRPVLNEARGILEDGRALAGDDPDVQARLDRVEAALNYTDLFYHARPLPRRRHGDTLDCRVSPERAGMMEQLFTPCRQQGIVHYGEQYGRYTTMSSLERAWLASTGSHPLLTLRAGGAEAQVCPTLGGRIVTYGRGGDANLLGEGSPKTFGYPCLGGYEEYALRAHQSPGFSEIFTVTEREADVVTLIAGLEVGLRLERTLRLTTDGSIAVNTALVNSHDAAIYGCVRAHLEIDLGGPANDYEFWRLREGQWTRQDGTPGGVWYDDAVDQGWAFYCPATDRGIWQTWHPDDVHALFLGSVPVEPTVLALDLCRGRDNEPIPVDGCQRMRHRFGIIAGDIEHGLKAAAATCVTA